MSVTHLPAWHVTAIEIALDLENLQVAGPAVANFSGPAEPRVCLVTCFALTSQLKRIVTAVDRAIPARLPTLRVAPAQARGAAGRHAGNSAPRSTAVAIAPMLSLLRLQQRLISAIQPGLADQRAAVAAGQTDLDEATTHFIGDFVPNKSLPTFEPSVATAEFLPARLRVTGVTIYSLGTHGAPRSILGHWAYAQDARGSIHLGSGP